MNKNRLQKELFILLFIVSVNFVYSTFSVEKVSAFKASADQPIDRIVKDIALSARCNKYLVGKIFSCDCTCWWDYINYNELPRSTFTGLHINPKNIIPRKDGNCPMHLVEALKASADQPIDQIVKDITSSVICSMEEPIPEPYSIIIILEGLAIFKVKKYSKKLI